MEMEFTGERYVPQIHGNIELEHMHRYLMACELASGKDVLDIASGEGYGSARLAQSALHVYGVDISTESVKHARSRYPLDNVSFLVGSCDRIPLPDQSVDLVVSFETIEHHDKHEEMMLEIKRVLRPGGSLLISSPDKQTYTIDTNYRNSYHIKELFASEFKELISRHFKQSKHFGQKITYGSAILEEDGSSPLKSYWDHENEILGKSGSYKPIYLLALASDYQLPLVYSGIYDRPETYSAYAAYLHMQMSARDEQIAMLRSEGERIANDKVAEVSQLRGQIAMHRAEGERITNGKDAEISLLHGQIAMLRSEGERIASEKDAEIYQLQQRLVQCLWASSRRVTILLHKVAASIRRTFRLPQRPLLEKSDEYLRIRQGVILESASRQIYNSSLFDADYYLANNPDVASSGLDAATHFLLHGCLENRNPSAVCSAAFYNLYNPSFGPAQINPLLRCLWDNCLKGGPIESQPRVHEVTSGSATALSAAKYHNELIEVVELAAGRDHRNGTGPTLDEEVNVIKMSGLFDENFYRSTYRDLPPPPFDVIRHYCEAGWREGRNPSDAFDTNFYLATYSDIRDAGINPFLHYIVAGSAESRHAIQSVPEGCGHGVDADQIIEQAANIIKLSGLFDENFYRSTYPALRSPSLDVIRHYCEYGWREGKNPSDDFDTNFYLATYSDIRDAGMNPFLHYIVAGSVELRHAIPDLNIHYEDDIYFGNLNCDIKPIAFYTSSDWTGLRGWRTQFKGHMPPPFPHNDLVSRDPSDWRLLKDEAAMAKRHGLYGFCFDLGSGTTDEGSAQPVECFLEHDEIDFHFCVHAEIAAPVIPEPLVTYLVRAISDRRCIRIDGRGVILVTLDGDIQQITAALQHLRCRLSELGAGNPFVIGQGATSIAGDCLDPSLSGLCDAVFDLARDPVPGETGNFLPLDRNGVDVVPYQIVASHGVDLAGKQQGPAKPLYQTVTLARDNTATKPERPLVYTRFHLRDYRRWLDAAIAYARVAHPLDRRFVFINGWNDWNAGLAIAPDRLGGYCRINETSRALLDISQDEPMPKVSVIVPNYNHEVFLARRLDSIYGQTYKNLEVILLDDCSSDQSRTLLDQYAAAYPDITRKLYNDKNAGSAFRQWAKGIRAATGDLVWIAESDDFCDERFLEVLVRCFDDEAVLLAYAPSAFVDENEVPIRDDFKSYLSDLKCAEKWNAPYVETAHSEVRNALGIKNTIPNASGVIFKRPVNLPLLEDESWLSMVVAGDWVFYLHIIRGGKIAFNTGTTNFFRRYEGSAAQVTYRKEVFYREVALASRTVAALYNVPQSVLEQSRLTYQTVYRNKVGGNDEEFALWYDFPSILKAREGRMPNVLVSTMGFFPGGAEILPIRMANEFKRQGLSVLLLNAGLNPREDGVRRMLREDVPVVETSSVEDMKSIIHEFGVEALNTHQWHIQKYPMLLPDVFAELETHVASLHGMIEHGDAFGVTEEQLRKADKYVTTWVYTAEKNVEPFSKIGLYDKHSSRFVKLPNGMPTSHIVPIPRSDMGIPENAFVFCCVSRAIPDKGWAETILVVERARKLSGLDIRLILVGNGPVYDDYCRNGVPDFVYLAGFSENSVGHYAAADMGIMLTTFKSESFPLTIVDCLFAGKPYIATAVGDIRNMLTVSDAIAGAVIDLADWEVPIEDSAQVVASFALDRQKYAKALTLVQDAANRYHIDVVAAQYIRLFARNCGVNQLPYSNGNH